MALVHVTGLGERGADRPQARLALANGRELARHCDGLRVRLGQRLAALALAGRLAFAVAGRRELGDKVALSNSATAPKTCSDQHAVGVSR